MQLIVLFFMIKRIIILFILIVCEISLAHSQISFKICGIVNNSINQNIGLKDGDTISLKISQLDYSKSTVLRNGKFEFQDLLPEPSVGFITCIGGGLKILIDNSDFFIKINQIEFNDQKKKFITYEMNVNTSSNFHTLWKNFYGDIMSIKNEINALKDSIIRFSDLSSMYKYSFRISNLEAKIINKYNFLATQNPDNFATPYILLDAPDFSYKNYIKHYNSLNPKVKNSNSASF